MGEDVWNTKARKHAKARNAKVGPGRAMEEEGGWNTKARKHAKARNANLALAWEVRAAYHLLHREAETTLKGK
jgi:hypothetical protein